MSRPSLSRTVARRLALDRQHLLTRAAAGARQAAEVIRSIGLLQLDYSAAVMHSHLLVLHSRLDHCDAPSFHALWSPYAVVQERRLHAASLVHRDHLPALAPLFASRRNALRYSHRRNLGPQPQALLAKIQTMVEEARRPVCAAQLDLEGLASGRHGTWWRRSTGRVALDALAFQGRLAVHSRRQGVPYYVAAGDTVPPAPTTEAISECLDWMALRAIAVQGAADIAQIADYYRMSVTDTRAAVARLVSRGQALAVQPDFAPSTWYMRPEDLDHVNDLEAADMSALLSPFDNLIWHRARLQSLFSFEFKNTMYLTKRARAAAGMGYFVMPFLHRGELVARVDLRADRAADVLRVLDHSIEEGQRGRARSVTRSLEAAVTDLAGFAGLDRVDWNQSAAARGWCHE